MQSGLAGQPHQVPIAHLILGQHQEVVISIRHLAMVGSLREIKLAPQNGLDPLLLHGVEEVHRTVDIAVVGDGSGGLPHLADVRGQLVNVAGSIEERIVGMKMEMGKLCCHTPSLEPHAAEENAANYRPTHAPTELRHLDRSRAALSAA